MAKYSATTEAATRIGCGAVVGLVVGLVFVVSAAISFSKSGVALGAVVLLSIVVCGFLGWRYGDRFFHSLHKWIRWLP
jgi:O-antigen/teichoic acid export membrane protein